MGYCNIILSAFFFLCLGCFILFVRFYEYKGLVRLLAQHLYESTIDSKPHTRPNLSAEDWKKPLFLVYCISLNLYSYWIPQVSFPAYPMIPLFI